MCRIEPGGVRAALEVWSTEGEGRMRKEEAHKSRGWPVRLGLRFEVALVTIFVIERLWG